MSKKIIRGSGGPPSPPPPRQPTRTPDTLHSRQFATFLDLISEGEIEGFASASKEGRTKGTTAYNNAALKDVFLNDTPVLRSTADSTSPATTDFNFQDVSFEPRFGTSNQTKIAGIESSSSVTSVGVEVAQASPVTRQITNSNVDAVNVTITFPQIQKATNEGDLLGSTVQLKISVQYNSGGFTDVITDTVTGRTADAYQKDYRVNLTGSFPVDIRVTRITADSSDSSLIDAFQWTSFGEIIDDANTYPNSAYASIRLDSMQFSSIPSRKFRIRGVKVRIPGAGANSSGTPSVDSATGRIVYPDGYIFNGVMGAAQWCSCPSMILLDLLTNSRYGFGDHITDSTLDLFSFVTASKFANTLVSNGLGGQEARFSCNVNIQGSGEAFTLINELAGVMRCMPIWSAGSITMTQDKPSTASYLFNLSNITSEGFNYSGSSLKQRHTVIAVSYFNMDSKEIDYEVVEDAAAISKFGQIVKQVKAFACTSRGQAARLGKAILFAEQNESEVINFTTSIDSGVVVRPGAIISVADPVRSGLRRGGKIASVTSTTVITVDDSAATSLPTTNNPTISVIMPDGTVETKDVSSISGATITVSSAFSQTPNVNANWLIQDDTVNAQLFRVITVEEQDGINYAITGLSYVNEKYAFIEDGASLPTRTVSILNELKDPPTALQAEEKLVVINNQAVSKLIISWQPVIGVTQYQVNYRFNNGNFISTTVSSPDFEIFNTSIGTYEIQVFSYNTALELSATSTDLTFNAVGKTAVPSDVSGLSAEPINEKLVRLRWNLATDLDVTHGGRVYVRHSPLTNGNGTFSNSTDLIEALAGNTTTAEVPYLEGEYILKFRDDGGRFSSGEASVILDLPDNLAPLVTQTRREDQDSPKFQGTKTNVDFDATTDTLNLIGGGNFDDITDFDTVGSLDDFGGIVPLGTYDFGGTAGGDTLDLGGVFSLDLKRHFLTEAFYPSDLLDSRGLIDDVTDFDGATATEVNAEMLVRVTQDNPSSGSPTYTAFQTFANGTYKGRGFQFRAKLTSNDVAQDIKVSQLGYTASIQRRTEQGNLTASGAGAKNVTFQHPFFVGTSSLLGANSNLPSVGINAQNMVSGDYFEVSNVSSTGFTVHFKNSSNASIDRNFTYQAVGFGKGV
jgi:predicted phage tail protein|tara:strand:+ start:2669 stop:6076 length:3408 start_codon:yes stop_codon:yes gene_type:complete